MIRIWRWDSKQNRTISSDFKVNKVNDVNRALIQGTDCKPQIAHSCELLRITITHQVRKPSHIIIITFVDLARLIRLFFIQQLVCEFGLVDIYKYLFLALVCFYIIQVLPAIFRLYILTLKITSFYTKWFVLPYFIDVVSTLYYYA